MLKLLKIIVFSAAGCAVLAFGIMASAPVAMAHEVSDRTNKNDVMYRRYRGEDEVEDEGRGQGRGQGRGRGRGRGGKDGDEDQGGGGSSGGNSSDGGNSGSSGNSGDDKDRSRRDGDDDRFGG